MCATGLPSEDPEHAIHMVKFAFEVIQIMDDINRSFKEEGLPVWDIRIGIHSGPVVAGVVGEKKFAYDIWGDSVNIASRMESSGEPGRINISEATFDLIKSSFICETRGKIGAKNKGEMSMFFVSEPKLEQI
jgi:class 3 adenylate cyclase